MPIRLSWSRYQSFDSCRLQHNLRYEQRVQVEKPRLIYLVGAVVHNVVKDWYEARFQDGFIERHILAVFEQMSKGIHFATSKARSDLLEKSVHGALETEKVYRQLNLLENKAEIELWFDVPFPQREDDRLVGGLDVYDPVEATIYDLKMYSDRNTADIGQVLTYGVAISTLGRPVSRLGFITPLLRQKLSIRPVSPQELSEQQLKLMVALDEMKTNTSVEATVGSHCTFCEYRGTLHCPATSRSGGPASAYAPAGPSTEPAHSACEMKSCESLL